MNRETVLEILGDIIGLAVVCAIGLTLIYLIG